MWLWCLCYVYCVFHSRWMSHERERARMRKKKKTQRRIFILYSEHTIIVAAQCTQYTQWSCDNFQIEVFELYSDLFSHSVCCRNDSWESVSVQEIFNGIFTVHWIYAWAFCRSINHLMSKISPFKRNGNGKERTGRNWLIPNIQNRQVFVQNVITHCCHTMELIVKIAKKFHKICEKNVAKRVERLENDMPNG